MQIEFIVLGPENLITCLLGMALLWFSVTLKNLHDAEKRVNVFITSRLDYYNSLSGCPKNSEKPSADLKYIDRH